MFGAVFLVMCAYYLVKPLREGWIAASAVAGLSRLEIKAYSSLAQSLLLAGAVALYARAAARWPRRVLVTRTSLVCLGTLAAFWLLRPGFLCVASAGVGIAFYLWVGMFGIFIVAQFWAFATDLYHDERGRRLLPMIAIGGTAGAAAGSWLHEHVADAAGADAGLLAAIVPLALSIVLLRRAEGTAGTHAVPRSRTAGAAARRLLGRAVENRFLVAAGMLALLFSWATTNGEHLLFHVVQQAVTHDAAALHLGTAATLAHTRAATTAFYGDFYFWTNVVALGAQILVASQIIRHRGLAVILLALPVLALVASAALVLAPVLAIVKWVKIAEQATDYSLNQTARHVVWLPISAEAKYESKPTVDGTFVRLGDGFAALTVLASVALGGCTTATFVGMNVILVVLWAVTALILLREHARLLALAAPVPAAARRVRRWYRAHADARRARVAAYATRQRTAARGGRSPARAAPWHTLTELLAHRHAPPRGYAT
jgi:AAA family ATP:ADP antiporter